MEEATEIEKNFETLFKQHYQQLCSYAFTFLKDAESSEDVVQELFSKIWEKQKLEIGATQLKYYLFTAVRNNCITRLQKNKKNYFEELKDEDATDEMKIFLEKNEEAAQPKELIAKAMELLPPKCREVFLLSRLSGHTYMQIAESLGISVKTVENQMGKAIRLMKAFAKENNIYAAMLSFIFFEKNLSQAIGVFINNTFLN